MGKKDHNYVLKKEGGTKSVKWKKIRNITCTSLSFHIFYLTAAALIKNPFILLILIAFAQVAKNESSILKHIWSSIKRVLALHHSSKTNKQL